MPTTPRNRLGDLERVVMEELWTTSDAHPEGRTVREVHDAIGVDRGLAYTTLMTVLDRMAKKGLVHRERDGRAWRYTAASTRAELTSEALHPLSRACRRGPRRPRGPARVAGAARPGPGHVAAARPPVRAGALAGHGRRSRARRAPRGAGGDPPAGRPPGAAVGALGRARRRCRRQRARRRATAALGRPGRPQPACGAASAP